MDNLDWAGDRFLCVPQYNGKNWLLATVWQGPDVNMDITTDSVHASELIDAGQCACLFAASITLYHASIKALDAILHSRPDDVPLTEAEKAAVRWLRAALAYAADGTWSDPELPWHKGSGTEPQLGGEARQTVEKLLVEAGDRA